MSGAIAARGRSVGCPPLASTEALEHSSRFDSASFAFQVFRSVFLQLTPKGVSPHHPLLSSRVTAGSTRKVPEAHAMRNGIAASKLYNTKLLHKHPWSHRLLADYAVAVLSQCSKHQSNERRSGAIWLESYSSLRILWVKRDQELSCCREYNRMLL
jgi:hypothetical protein